ncbi:DUF1156 domain-containing protein [Paracoccus sp. S-4012]|uniref:DUF1156 domain-containing protein n=1 Tax=Paracoccus sp. S-4012 TaxID=2665648 RepID=UPI0012AF593F|nr:DUF1156 domain-containing protein [Paracoccus sp. S-4012]MRX50206.1 DUF1156 domain-containing protein [Paracoccus sp. S-4012]
MPQTYKKKLIEVAIPLEAINAASAREKSIRHGHPSTLHLWWARRPLAACRAVLFAQLVDDPSSCVDELMADPQLRARAEGELPGRVAAWEKSKAAAKGAAANAPKPTLEDVAVEIERKRLFAIIEDLVKWENSTNEEVLERARAEIRRSCGGVLPPVYDPFSGGGSIPLEAQRLGLPAYGSDLNPVAVMIGKAMIEIPPKFKDMPPIHPGIKERSFYRNAEGLAEDVRYYGNWVREKAWERIGHLYPQVDLPKEYGGGKATVIAWIWARTVPSPDPAFSDVQVPVTSSFTLGTKPGREAWIEATPSRMARSVSYEVKRKGTKEEIKQAKKGTKSGQANFRCIISDAPISGAYVDAAASRGKMGRVLLAVAAEGKRGRVYLSPTAQQLAAVESANEEIGELNTAFLKVPCRGTFASNAQGRRYGFETFEDYFLPRQLASLTTLSDVLRELQAEMVADCIKAGIADDGIPLADGGRGAKAYAEAVRVYLAFAIDRSADRGSTICSWDSSPKMEALRNTFARQAIPMTWDFAEGNPFSGSSGNFSSNVDWVARAVELIVPASDGHITQHDAQTVAYPPSVVISSDPPYYDNIEYSDLSDFFYVWLKKNCADIYPDSFGFLSTPKSEELVATRYRHGGQDEADIFFLDGMTKALEKMTSQIGPHLPATIYYAFKQSEMESEGISSTGWATFLQAVVQAGFSIVGTWPMRTEMSNRMVAAGTNALANSVVLVCRKKEATADTVTRAEFIRALKRELPPAIAELQAANIAPADMPQSAIGPGMGVFSRHRAVLEADDSAMTVKTALQLINAELDEYLGGIRGEFDVDTRFAITWFEQHGMGKGDYGVADNLARARGISVDSVKHANIVESAAGKVRLLKRNELDPDWAPEEDGHLTVWECLQHLVRLHERTGLSHDSAALLKRFGPQAEAVKDLAYCLYDIAANKRREASEATVYNALIADWSELSQMAATVSLEGRNRQTRFEL